MFELSVVKKYLLPRKRQLSVSIISLISILVISLVVWLIVVFFSVTEGLEKSWVNKLIALTAPVRITPTDAYYRSYYYRVDGLSAESDYSLKSIAEKKESLSADPYDESIDEEIPSYWPKPDLDKKGELKDVVKLAYQSIDEIKEPEDIAASDYEITAGDLRLRLLRRPKADTPQGYADGYAENESFLDYPSYLGIFEPGNALLNKTLLPVTAADINNLILLSGMDGGNTLKDRPEEDRFFDAKTFRKRVQRLLSFASINQVTIPRGRPLPRQFYPAEAEWLAYAIMHQGRLSRIVIPIDGKETYTLPEPFAKGGYTAVKTKVQFKNSKASINLAGSLQTEVPQSVKLVFNNKISAGAKIDDASIIKASSPGDLRFHVRFGVQNSLVEGEALFNFIEVNAAAPQIEFESAPIVPPLWVYAIRSHEGLQFRLPEDPEIGEGVLLPKSFREAGALIGDRGYLAYQTFNASAKQEQRIPIYVAGFYDPGIIPIGGRFIFASRKLAGLISASYGHDQNRIGNGINVRFSNLKQASEIKEKLQRAFIQKGIDSYWNIETYKEYEFTKDLIQQLQSEKNLFTLLAMVIIIVACSNIVSMLIILVNDKKVEIGILRSMGASSKSIAAIFGLCGFLMGLIGSVIGIAAAIFTLHNLQALIDLISRIQGYELFNKSLFGETMPHEFSLHAMGFVVIATALISLIAGIVPAVKASLLRPSTILRSE